MTGYKSKVDIIYDILIDRIAAGYYAAGDRLVISQVARENRVSDIPVREAIRWLEREGYVEMNANQGPVVCGFTKESLQEVFEIKAVLEAYAARLSIDYLKEKDIEELREANEAMRSAYGMGDLKRYAQLNIDFHLRIYRDIPQRELYGMIVGLWKKYSITRSVFSLAPTRAEHSIAEHEAIIHCLARKAYGEIEGLMRAHKMQAGLDLTKELGNRKQASHSVNESEACPV